jgi:DNA-binding NtrC family response regulator
MLDAPNEQSRAASWDFARHNTPDAVLTDERQPEERTRDARRATVPAASSSDEASLSLMERRHIAAVLQCTNWHQGKAASLLGISAKTLYRKIREFGFARPARGSREGARARGCAGGRMLRNVE